ncbi:unnamed protein product [Arabidopsis arenosa]|uniref:Uncharacterized protein n=1 Tax=Arabidopsis arenosa TaxID=38785 RepID=A0A8S2AGH0_ARAAE|nr:unnamed protein product [Arabidopsis arenosa]
MQRGKDDDKRGFCRRLLRLVVVKLMAGHKEDRSVTKKLIKKESKSDITIYFKQREDSEDNANNPINISRSSEKERVIMLVNGSNGSKKNLASELSVRRSVAQTGAEMMMEMEKETSGRQEEEHNPFCDAFCKPFEGLYQQCMAVCPRTKSIGGDGVANGELQANEEVCETSCSILQEEPLTIRCMRICHERIPGAVASST